MLTKDYIHCFKKGSGRITEMGGFVFKVEYLRILCVQGIMLKNTLRSR